ncbi:MAG: PepSY-associated TM helix domain-containing protein [Ilumatobacter sp.]|nr:PepSY-associated TM helix domain-containing protein [Ilumatobacter sp.]
MTVTERPIDPLLDPDDVDRATADSTPPAGRRPNPGRRFLNKWSRSIHVYASMVALVITLFFGLTGLTLNHPDWTFGDAVDVTTESGTLGVTTTMDDGSVDFLSVSEFARDELGVSGSVDSFDLVNGEGSIVYKNPGYSADLFFDVETGTYDLTVEQQGWVAVLNDLHKGRDAGNSWSWLIDLSAGFLVVISITGLVMQFFLKRRRRSAFITAGVGAAVVVALAWWALR